MHNYDIEFGDFIKRFDENDNLRKKTALILTADHATFPDGVYMNAFNDYRPYFFGHIPLILHADGVSASRVDAQYKNSLDFAPTLLHWLRIKEGKNYFLGCSLYDDECPYSFEYIYALGDREYCYTNGIKLLTSNSRDYSFMVKIRDFYNISENIESSQN